MTGFVAGAARGQLALLPECLDDWVDESNPVRAVDVFVEALDLRDLGFAGVDPAATGRPSYHPSVPLKLYIYGYLNRVQSSRRLEREAGRNLEVIWLLGRLAPDHKTIAAFRKDNGPAKKNLRAIRRAVPADGIAVESQRCDRRVEIQSREQSRQQLHERQAGAAAEGQDRFHTIKTPSRRNAGAQHRCCKSAGHGDDRHVHRKILTF